MCNFNPFSKTRFAKFVAIFTNALLLTDIMLSVTPSQADVFRLLLPYLKLKMPIN